MGRKPPDTRFIAGAVTLGLMLILGLTYVLRPIPPTAFVQRGGAIVFVDRSGLPLGTVLARDTEHAVHVPLAAVSPHFLATIVALEDARFYHHPGVDVASLARAAWEVLRTRHVVSGGSTITMQLARLRYDVPRTLWGKLRETVLALRIERGNAKPAILADYVNRLPMGGNLVGVEAGARTYFGTPAADLDWAQAALLAVLPNDPVALDPYVHRAALERRRIAVLTFLQRRGVIGAADARRAIAERIVILPRHEGIGDAPHLMFRLASAADAGTERIQTTIDRDLQRYLANTTQAVVASLHDQSVSDAAAIVIDNATGDVLAYTGSPNYFADAILGRNDGVVALRQPGSTLKPFLYELAFERRVIRPNSILRDVPTVYAIPGGRTYQPADYSGSFAGPVRARIALANSLNVPAVRTLSALGVPAFENRLHELGFAHLDKPPDYYGLGLTLGSGEVTLEELARAYATIARGGEPLRLLYTSTDPQPVGRPRVGSEPEWRLVTDMLSDPYARARSFGVASLLRLPFPSAVKTGTSSDFRDTWTVGFTRTYTVAAWVGNFNGAPMQRVTGVTGAAPLWNRIMLHLAEKTEPGRFAPPAGYARTPMCATTGAAPDPACPAIVAEWLDAGDRRSLHRAVTKIAALRIESPQDGGLYRTGGRIVLRATSRTAVPVRWSVNGRFAGTGTAVPLTLQRGELAIVASSGAASATAHISVSEPRTRAARGGFTIVR